MKYSIIGFSRSGIACAKLLKNMGEEVFVSDIQQKNIESVEGLDGIKFEFGVHSEKILESDIIVLSPGVSIKPKSPIYPLLLKAKEKNIPVIGEMELASRFINNPIISITGTNGKTTTCFLINNVLKTANIDVMTCGNMGVPLSSIIEKINNKTIIVMETSCFQLETIELFHPWIAIILNITPDHMDRYDTFEEYKNTKIKITKNQTNKDFTILNFDYHFLRDIPTQSKKIFFSTRDKTELYLEGDEIYWMNKSILNIKELNIRWDCWLECYLAAIVVAEILNIPEEKIKEGLSSFKGVPHRLEEVDSINGVKFINNSMCTNPDAFVKAIYSLQEPVILIAGGKDKGMDIKPIAEAINKKAKCTILIGEVSKKLGSLISVPHIYANNMEEAVKYAYSFAEKGDTVFLSPGFASFDMFIDFADRGEKFKAAVKKLKDEENR